MRRTVGLFLVAIILLAITFTLGSHPRVAAKLAEDGLAGPHLEPSTESSSASHATSSSQLTPLISGTNTSNVTAQATNGTIYFNSDRDGNVEIYGMSSDSFIQTRLTNNSAVDADPVWSSNNQRIAFVTNRDGNFEIYTMDSDGSNPTRLTNNARPCGRCKGKRRF